MEDGWFELATLPHFLIAFVKLNRRYNSIIVMHIIMAHFKYYRTMKTA